MNPCVYTKMLMVEEEEAEKARDLGIEAPIYWEDCSFKIYDICRYHRHSEGGEEVGTTIEFNDALRYTVQMRFEEIRALEDAYYTTPEFIWRNPTLPS